MMAKITCLCDNNVGQSSKLFGEHGISFHIETSRYSALLDTGQSFDVLHHNALELGIDLDAVGTVMLSHGHYDHTGGLRGLLERGIRKVYAHPECFERKYKMSNGELKGIGAPMGIDEMEGMAVLSVSRGAQKVSDKLALTGEVPRDCGFESVPDVFFKKWGDEVVRDTILDDQSLIVEGRKEALLLLGCCHAGIVNTFEHAKTITRLPIRRIAGGSHLVSVDRARLEATARYFSDVDATLIGFHCTGDKASHFLAGRLGDSYLRGHVGMTFEAR